MSLPQPSTGPTCQQRPAPSVTVRVVETVAEQEGCRPLDLPPLEYSIDTEALERFPVADGGRAAAEPPGTLTFAYEGYEVAVTRDGDVSARPRDH